MKPSEAMLSVIIAFALLAARGCYGHSRPEVSASVETICEFGSAVTGQTEHRAGLPMTKRKCPRGLLRRGKCKLAA